mmetsp:Transcript_17284/g.28123  ORF Transcript_17284/g.28123 Transcript_17284/m.28123 type:complete len:316 (-) Transcript_17284:186-1133(-)
MEEYPEQFKPFIFDEEYAEYIKRMRKDGEWGGNLELVGISHAFGLHLTIHQLGLPRWEIKNPNNVFSRVVHLGYHDGEHYTSIRNISDDPRKEATEIKAFTNNSNKYGGGQKNKSSYDSSHHHSSDSRALKILRESTGCKNIKFIGEALADNGNDVDATVQYLIEMRESGVAEFFMDDNQENEEKDDAREENEKKKKSGGSTSGSRKVNRNGPCPCKSGKKYKSCCAKADKVAREGARRARRKDSLSPGRSRKGGKNIRIQKLSNKQRKELARKAKMETSNKDDERKAQKGGKLKTRKEDIAQDEPQPDLGSLQI